jgi:hypothetical protein
MSTLTVTLPSHTSVTNGKQVVFRAPCDCVGVTGLIINNNTYTLMDAANNVLSSVNTNAFKAGAMISVVLDVDNYKAYIQGASSGAEINGVVVSQNSDLSEVCQWSDSNPSKEDRSGYFVNITGLDKISKATSTSDVRGVTTSSSGFAMNADKNKYDANGTLLSKYNYVCFNGPVVVRTATNFASAPSNSKCVPNNSGVAVLSSNGVGYQVLDVVDSTHAYILFEPQMHLCSKFRSDIDTLQSDVANVKTQLQELSGLAVGTDAPAANAKLLWIDTTPVTGGLKYHNGSEWIHVPVAYAT